MGARGSLKLPPHLRAVKTGDEIDAETTAASVTPRVAPNKPQVVADHKALSDLWDEIVPQLDEAGLVAPSDGPAIEMALRHLLLARAAHKQIIDEGDLVTAADHNHGGVKKHPAEAVLRAESDLFLRYAQQLGMTFVARARTVLKGTEGGEDNPFASPAGG
jgi:P27 family predicted phage terminase small subunit